MGIDNQAKILFRYLRWFGRIVGFLATGFFLLFFICEGVPDIIKNGMDTQIIPFLMLLFLAITGYIIAIFNEKAGGIMQIAGGVAMSIYHLWTGGFKDLNMALVFGLPFIICGSIFLLCWWKCKIRTV